MLSDMTDPDLQVKSRAIRLYPGCPSSPIPHSHLDNFLKHMRSNALWLNIIAEWAHLINAVCEPILYCRYIMRGKINILSYHLILSLHTCYRKKGFPGQEEFGKLHLGWGRENR